jgi:hypothetical protein
MDAGTFPEFGLLIAFPKGNYRLILNLGHQC